MSNRIHILSNSLMKRIAAGEVVERPASVAKELIENSIDAGAANISLHIKESGFSLIQVIDDGEGMSHHDTKICFERHATSKIEFEGDLEAIDTLGFRGEALASISSVSRMEIRTCRHDDSESINVHIMDNQIQKVVQSAPIPGTTVSVKDLFYNVPARKKFLKTPATELKQLVLTFKRIALAYPHIRFTLLVNDQKTMDLPKGNSEDRMKDVFGVEKYTQLVPIEREAGKVSITGYISRPGEFRKSREDQFIFLNRRYIVNRTLTHAILSSYGPRLDKNEYPIYIIFISLDPKYVDVNVHPSKIEVRFADERFIHSVLHHAAKEAMQSSKIIPDLHLIQGKHFTSKKTVPKHIDLTQQGQLTLDVQRPSSTHENYSSKQSYNESYQFWQIHNKYILSQIKSGLTLIDQHAAHERILYERALTARNHQATSSQQLLFPQTIDLTPEQYMMLTEMLPYLEKMGFGIREFGQYTVMIESVPIEVKNGSERELLIEMMDYFSETQKTYPDIWEAVAASYACKNAIKTGDPLTDEEMANLIDQLFATSEPYFCPHGRPIVVNLTLEEIDKRFGR